MGNEKKSEENTNLPYQDAIELMNKVDKWEHYLVLYDSIKGHVGKIDISVSNFCLDSNDGYKCIFTYAGKNSSLCIEKKINKKDLTLIDKIFNEKLNEHKKKEEELVVEFKTYVREILGNK